MTHRRVTLTPAFEELPQNRVTHVFAKGFKLILLQRLACLHLRTVKQGTGCSIAPSDANISRESPIKKFNTIKLIVHVNRAGRAFATHLSRSIAIPGRPYFCANLY